MKIVHPNSLAETIDALNEVFFYGHKPAKAEREKAAMWIAGRQGLPRSYAGMFAPTDCDFAGSTMLFTGKKLTANASIAHILGEEASRALILLDVKKPVVQDALRRASEGILERLNYSGRTVGTYCCGMCTCSYWRHLAVGGLKNGERELTAGIRDLKRHRQGDGRWRRYPFYYTLLALSEIDLPAATREIRYAEPVLERLLKRAPKDEKYALRRREIVERALERC